MSGIGSEFFSPNTPAPSGVPTVTAANNGTSLNGTIVQLGQTVGELGDPAQLLHNTEIPFEGLFLAFRGAGSLELTELCDGNGTGTFFITTDNGHLFIHAGVRSGGFEGSLYIGYDAGLGASTSTASLQSMLAVGQGAFESFIATTLQNYRGAAIGAFSLQSQTQGIGNVALGWAAGQGGLSFNLNCLLGSVTGTNIDNGSDKNVFVGIGAGGTDVGNLTGGIGEAHSCVLIGYLAGGNNGTASVWTDVILIGAGTGKQTTPGNLTNATVIGSAITTDLNNVVLIGRFDQNVVIGAALAGEVDDGNKLQVRGNMSVKGIKPAIRTTAVLAETFGANDFTMICDTTAGNMIVDIDPTIHIGSLGNVKKISADVNSVTLTALSGLIFDIGAGTASVSINTQGENLSFQSDGTNIYIL